MITIYEQKRFLSLRLGVLVLGRDSAEDIDAWEVLERLILLCKFNWKVIYSVVQSIIELYWIS